MQVVAIIKALRTEAGDGLRGEPEEALLAKVPPLLPPLQACVVSSGCSG